MAANPRRQIFRESAMRQYLQRREQDVLPMIVSPPVFACSWFLLALILMAGLLAWSAELPTYISASGVIVQQGQQATSSGTSNTAQAIIFFPSADASHLRTGQAIKLAIGTTTSISSTITRVQAGIVSPSDARKLYGLDAGEAQVIKEPSTVVIVNLDKSIAAHAFAGSEVTAQVQVGTHSVLSQIT
jgi:hypothetical protein